jgi:protocatechuate 3,4-dioxygenase, alpha subunit
LKTGSKKKEGLVPIPSQTVGPYFSVCLEGPCSVQRIAPAGVKGERVKLTCTVFDRAGKPVSDSLIEIWQANAEGKYNHPADRQAKPIDHAFFGFGRQVTDKTGVCQFGTVKPGRVPGRGNTLQAPHLEVAVFARGILKQLITRIYFAGDAANDECPVLALVPKSRRQTLMAKPVRGQPGSWRHEIHLSGAKETAFFDI